GRVPRAVLLIDPERLAPGKERGRDEQGDGEQKTGARGSGCHAPSQAARASGVVGRWMERAHPRGGTSPLSTRTSGGYGRAMSVTEKATTLKALHEAPEILRVVNVWDAISAKVIADLPETKALATAGHSIAASRGYPDGGMPLDVALDGARIIAEAVDLPVSADLDDGYDDPGETVRRAIGFGIVGANVED